MGAAATPGGHLLLVGMMGAGKTTVGALVAARLGCAHFDSDAQIEAETGRTVPEILAADGEPAFRRMESLVLRQAVAEPPPVVISVAGGAVLDPANRACLRAAGTVVWLRADPATLAQRVGDGAGRPLLDGDPLGAMVRLEAVRRPLYEAVADVTVDVGGRNPAEVANEILAARDRLATAP